MLTKCSLNQKTLVHRIKASYTKLFTYTCCYIAYIPSKLLLLGANNTTEANSPVDNGTASRKTLFISLSYKNWPKEAPIYSLACLSSINVLLKALRWYKDALSCIFCRRAQLKYTFAQHSCLWLITTAIILSLGYAMIISAV
jgi:hypothetical protein